MKDRRLYTLLTLTGATPFVAAAVLPLLGFPTLEPFGDLVDLALSYALAIICFLAGIHWATYLYDHDQTPGNLFIASNVIVLVTWIPYLFAPVPVVAVVMILAFIALWIIDYRLRRLDVIDDHYLAVRTTATALAVISLATIAVT